MEAFKLAEDEQFTQTLADLKEMTRRYGSSVYETQDEVFKDKATDFLAILVSKINQKIKSLDLVVMDKGQDAESAREKQKELVDSSTKLLNSVMKLLIIFAPEKAKNVGIKSDSLFENEKSGRAIRELAGRLQLEVAMRGNANLNQFDQDVLDILGRIADYAKFKSVDIAASLKQESV